MIDWHDVRNDGLIGSGIVIGWHGVGYDDCYYSVIAWTVHVTTDGTRTNQSLNTLI